MILKICNRGKHLGDIHAIKKMIHYVLMKDIIKILILHMNLYSSNQFYSDPRILCTYVDENPKETREKTEEARNRCNKNKIRNRPLCDSYDPKDHKEEAKNIEKAFRILYEANQILIKP
jgi:hypothetical protein